MPIPRGEAGHWRSSRSRRRGATRRAGGAPLPSTVLMTAHPARVAGCKVVRSRPPKPLPIILAARTSPRADELIPVGGAHAIAALATAPAPSARATRSCGPGNMYVTAAKALVSGRVAIDMLAGPSEVGGDRRRRRERQDRGCDLLSQTRSTTRRRRDPDLRRRLRSRRRRRRDPHCSSRRARRRRRRSSVARRSRTATPSWSDASTLAGAISDRLAVEHVEVQRRRTRSRSEEAQALRRRSSSARAPPRCSATARAPTHTLPTGGTRAPPAAVSPFTFLRVRTWMRVDDKVAANEMVQDFTSARWRANLRPRRRRRARAPRRQRRRRAGAADLAVGVVHRRRRAPT